MKTVDIFKVWKEVFSNWKYTLLALIIAVAFFVLNVIIQNYQTVWFFINAFGLLASFKILYSLTLGFSQTTTALSFITIIIIALMLGMFISLFTLKVKSIKSGKEIGFLGTLGLILGVVAPGCAACGVGLLAVFGLTAGTLAVLPFKGYELSLLAIFILGFSIYKVSKGLLEGNVCKIITKDAANC